MQFKVHHVIIKLIYNSTWIYSKFVYRVYCINNGFIILLHIIIITYCNINNNITLTLLSVLSKG